MHNYPKEFDNIPIQQMSTTLRRQRRASFTTTSLIKYDNNRNNFIFGSGKNRKLSNLIVKEYQELEEEEEEGEKEILKNDSSPIEDVIRQLRNELQQTRTLVAELESRLELTEQTSQVIVGELKNLLSETESESHTTAVEIDQESEEDDDMKFDLNDDDDEFYVSSSPLIDQTYQEEIPITSIYDNDEVTPQIETSTSSLDSSIIQHADDTNDSYTRICSALQNLINDGQVALQKPNPSSSNQLLSLPQTTTRPRAQSWSSNVSSWIMNHYNTPPMVCECGTCWFCLESSGNSLSSTTTTTTRTTPKSSRANSISSAQRPSLSLTSKQQESYNTYDRQVNLAGIKKQYRKKLEHRSSSYRKSCDDLEMELQKLISTAISAGVEHGLMHSPVYREYDDPSLTGDRYNYFRNHNDEEMSDESHDENGEGKFSRFPASFSKPFGMFYKSEQSDSNNNNNSNKESSKWRRRIWNYLQKIGVNFNNYKNSIKENNEEGEGEDDEYSSYSSYSSYNSSWKPSSCDYQENSNEDTSNPFPSSFTNTLNIGQNIFNFNVNLINSTTNNYNKTTNNYFNEIDNSINTTSTTNNYNNCTNNHEEKSSQLNFTAKDNNRQPTSEKSKSLGMKFTNLLAMVGLMISMSQTTTAPSLMGVAARSIIRSSLRRRRSGSDMVLMIKVIKYATLLFVGWAAGRIGKNKKDSSVEKNRIEEIPSNN